ncbi:MAG: transcriptional regulator [Pseudomonadota bacterium]|jgi:prophage regulatory protein|nr:transcriptional regulator [Pseudomonadota bacterium]
MADLTLLRAEAVIARRGRSRSQLYLDIRHGVMTPPVRLRGGKLSAWPAREVDSLNAAEIAGATDDELRAVVRELLAQRAAGRPRAA